MEVSPRRADATARVAGARTVAGSVAAAVRFIAKAVLTGTPIEGVEISTPEFIAKAVLSGISQEFLRNHDIDKLRGNLTSDRGIGHTVIETFLEGVPGINAGTVQQALANLKASGDYGRIIGEVQALPSTPVDPFARPMGRPGLHKPGLWAERDGMAIIGRGPTTDRPGTTAPYRRYCRRPWH